MISNIKRFKDDLSKLKSMAYHIKNGKAFNSQHLTSAHIKCLI